MNEKQYQLLLAQAPDQDSDLFIDFLRANNTVVQEDKNWIVIENCKYHTKKIPWYTAFDKGGRFSVPYMDFITLNYRGWEWIKKETSRQTVPKRFHIHLTRKNNMETKPAVKQWIPNQGPQTEILLREEFELGFGGARGGGKTDAGLAWLTRDVGHPKFRALVIRKNATDLSDWLERAAAFYSGILGKRIGTHIQFPSGAIIRTGHLKDDNAFGKYQGHEYHRMLIEELPQIGSESNYLKLVASCRSTIPELKPQILSTFNPDGPGFFWVKKRFAINGTPSKPISIIDPVTGLSRCFVPSRLSDNPYLNQDEIYKAFLNGLPDGLREAWRDGSWNDPNIEGAYYTKEIQQARIEGRIRVLSYNPNYKVHTVWDLGISDAMTLLFVQKDAVGIYIIDCYSNEGFGLPHYYAKLQQWQQEKGYVYGKHYAPHDSNKRELATGKTVIQSAKDMGLEFQQIPMVGIVDGILKVRTMWPRVYVNEMVCEQALNAWLNYKKSWSEKELRFSDEPVHDWSSHFADTLRYLAMVEDQFFNDDTKKKPKDYNNEPEDRGLYPDIGL